MYNQNHPPAPMTSPEPVQPAQRPRESPPWLHKENLSHSHPSNPPETPTPPPSGNNGPRASESMPLPERHQATLHHIRTLESHNAKLYQDNCRLVNTINTLNDRLAFSGAPQNLQVHRLSDLQEKLRASEENRAMIDQKHQELLHCISAGTGSPHRHIYAELQAIRGAYASLDRDYRLLRENYVRMKAVVDISRAASQQSQGTVRGSIPVLRSEFRATDQSLNNSASPTSIVSPNSIHPFLDQKGSRGRRSSENTMAQPSLRSAPASAPTTWLPLPTPPSSAALPCSQISSTGFPVHAPVPAGSLPLPHHVPMAHDPRTLSGLPSVIQSRHLVEQDASEQPKAAVHLRQRCEEITDTNNNGPVPCGKQISTPAPLESNPRPPKRSTSELTLTSPGGEHKKPRTEGENVHPANTIPSQPPSTDPPIDHKSSVSGLDVRSYQDCVNLIFEKDGDVENGVFCGLCFDRHQAKMIPEPPDVLVQPDFDFLVMHCMTIHPAVWDDLRRKA